MNRRTAIRKAIGIGAAVAALPVLEQVSRAHGLEVGQAPPEWTPPPPDTRTPEQIIHDQDEEMLQDSLRHLTRDRQTWERRYAYGLWIEEYDRVLARLRAQRIPVTEIKIGGQDCVIGPNGNIVRKLGQILYLR